MIKSRRTNWAWYVTQIGDMKNAHKILTGKYEGTIHLGDQGGAFGRTILSGFVCDYRRGMD
jgi:hypothetical protein